MEQLIEAIKNKDLVKAKKIFVGLMEGIKDGLTEEERKKISSGVMTEDEEEPEDDDEEDEDSTSGKVDPSTNSNPNQQNS